MKFYYSLLVFLGVSVVIGLSTILAVNKGFPWLFLACIVGYSLAFYRYGCQEH